MLSPGQPPADFTGSVVAVWHLKRVKPAQVVPPTEAKSLRKVVLPKLTDLELIQGSWKVIVISSPPTFGEGQKDVEVEYRFKGTTFEVIRVFAHPERDSSLRRKRVPP